MQNLKYRGAGLVKHGLFEPTRPHEGGVKTQPKPSSERSESMAYAKNRRRSRGAPSPSGVKASETLVRKGVRGHDVDTPTKNPMVARCLERRGTSKKLPYGSGKDIAKELGISRTTVLRHLTTYDLQKADGQSIDMSRGRQGRCGRPNVVTDPWEVRSISRTSYRKWAVKSGIRLSSLWRLCKRVGARKHKRWVKPVPSDKQKRDRMGFALSHMHRKGGTRVVVDDMYDWVHVDEKWFYVKDGRESTCTQKRTPPNRQGPRTSDSSPR
ncbi:unnamed protein product [Discosporangium mesarthrocarpum]